MLSLDCGTPFADLQNCVGMKREGGQLWNREIRQRGAMFLWARAGRRVAPVTPKLSVRAEWPGAFRREPDVITVMVHLAVAREQNHEQRTSYRLPGPARRDGVEPDGATYGAY